MQSESGDAEWEEVIQLEEKRQEAMLAGDVRALELLFADDAVYTHSSGNVHDKQGYLKAFADREFVYEAIAIDDRRLVPVGDAVLIFGRSVHDVMFKSGLKRLNARFLSVWVRRDGTWRHVAWQTTPIPDGSTVSGSRQ
jgi:ketosteroid isomerase-like protein